MGLFKSLLLAVISIGAADALTRCGNSEPSAKIKAGIHEAWLNRPVSLDRITGITIDTYVHVVTSAAKRGRYTLAMVEKQMTVMNDSYRSMGISFLTKSINFTINAAWAAADMSSTAEKEMKTALHRGSYADLNIYLTSDLPNGLLGFCYFPANNATKLERILDGCMCLADSMPNGTATHYNEGLTAVHETGHWLGLYHTFQGYSCSGPGDFVSDTPLQMTATSGCPLHKDSCPSAPGLDPIHNYMDYSYDSCMSNFTSGQMDKAVVSYGHLRAGKY